MRIRPRAACALAAAVVVALQIAAAQTPKTTKDGVYAKDQADRGQTLYADQCAGCHGDDLSGGGFAPALTGQSFLSAWDKMTLDELFDRTRATMPADRPGTLSGPQNADLLAYMLKSNGFAVGGEELPADLTALKQITIVTP